MYRPVPAQVDLPAMEHEVLAWWREHDVFARSMAATADGPSFVFYEGPPTANGMPGTHHVEARVFKDVFPRYRTMKGYHVPRKAGWDCHGLPVEIAVEKELGFTAKGDIEAFGVAEFNARCRASVERHVDAFEQMTERMGYWVDMSQAYRTMDADYVQSVWWSLKQIWERGLLVRDHRVTPYCPRCGTGLSDHELAQGYESIVDPSVYVRFPLTSGPLRGRADLLVWTTTPWTLVSNTAVAAHPDVDYVVVEPAVGSPVVVAEPLLGQVPGLAEATVVERFTGAQMERWTYRRPLDLIDIPDAHYVVVDTYVTTEDGTGLVHQAPAFGPDDLRVGRAYGLPVVNPVQSDGRFAADVPVVGGQFFKHADADLVNELRDRGLLFAHLPYEHSYPHCWRCHTPLIYYAQPSWYIRTTAVKDELLRENERTNWYPDNVKWGRYGDWLRNNVDWALSRSRFWGTPLPVWVNDEDPTNAVCVGSLAELSELAGVDLSGLDPHRPYVDDVTFTVPGVSGTFRRVPEVIDVWYDSGAMPFAQWGYPYADGSVDQFDATYPAQFISEALDQTRGWFYSLMAVGTLVFDRSSYENVVCLGLILAEDGRRMSKHLGNILEPIPLMDDHGADALRWFMLASGSPWQPRKIGHTALQEVVRKVLLTYWNTAAFLSLYGRTANYDPSQPSVPVADRPSLDRWALARVHQMVADVDAALADFDSPRAGRSIAAFVDDLSNWYVRRSRRRFWDGDPAALATLHECLRLTTLVMAPLVPFITERVWRDLFASTDADAPDSVHLARWPEVDRSLLSPQLAEQTALVRRLVELGRSARAESGVKTRQPLSRALVGASGWADLPDDLRTQLAEELNVQVVEDLGDHAAELVEVSAKANFRALGKRFGRQTPAVAAAVATADAGQLAASLRQTGTVEVAVGGEPVSIEPDEVILTETPRQGWAVADDGGDSLALDLELTDELRDLGRARDVVRLVQEARKTSGLDVSDRIALWWDSADEQTRRALTGQVDAVAAEVLAVAVTQGAAPESALAFGDEDLGLVFAIERRDPSITRSE
jgi:isoleucyl-tRNA synthetase